MQSLDDDKLERKWTAITDRCYGTSLPVSYWIFVGIIYHTWVEPLTTIIETETTIADRTCTESLLLVTSDFKLLSIS